MGFFLVLHGPMSGFGGKFLLVSGRMTKYSGHDIIFMMVIFSIR